MILPDKPRQVRSHLPAPAIGTPRSLPIENWWRRRELNPQMVVRNVSQKVGFNRINIGEFSLRRFLSKVGIAKKNELNLSPIVSKYFGL
ncbi:MAG: hypothetical protein ACREDS_16410 [Limisphaerales bacterium]